jgi:hypothetical protein
MHVKGFYIVSPGDSSVGIQPTEWVLDNGFEFEFDCDLKGFKDALEQVFADFVADDIYVETIEERETFLEVERKYMTPPNQ